MKAILIGLSAVVLAALTAGCGYSERTYAVAAPGAEYYGDAYYAPSYYYPSRTAYVRYY
jgi:hypothetical protein